MRYLLLTSRHLDSRECPFLAELLDRISLTMIILLSSDCPLPLGTWRRLDNRHALSNCAYSMMPIASLPTELNCGHQKLSSSQIDTGS